MLLTKKDILRHLRAQAGANKSMRTPEFDELCQLALRGFDDQGALIPIPDPDAPAIPLTVKSLKGFQQKRRKAGATAALPACIIAFARSDARGRYICNVSEISARQAVECADALIAALGDSRNKS